MDTFFKFELFFTSFLPLWISILIIDIWAIFSFSLNNSLKLNLSNIILYNKLEFVCSIILLIFIVLISLNIFMIFNRKSKINLALGCVNNVSKAKKLSAEFLIAYILPMTTFDFSNIKDLVLFLLCFGVLAFLCIRNDNIYVNIFLEFLGYKMYICDVCCHNTSSKKEYLSCLVLSKVDITIPSNGEIKYFKFDNFIYVNTFKEIK